MAKAAATAAGLISIASPSGGRPGRRWAVNPALTDQGG